MKLALIVSDNPVLVKSIKRRIGSYPHVKVREFNSELVDCKEDLSSPQYIGENSPISSCRHLENYRRISSFLKSELTGKMSLGGSGVVAFGDMSSIPPDINLLNPIGANCLPQLIAMLILSFPEVHWILIWPGILGETRKIETSLWTKHAMERHLIDPFNKGKSIEEILEWFEYGYMPIFDPSGLRNTIRWVINENSENSIATRGRVSVSIDDESAYAMMNAYTAYRMGYRSFICGTNCLMAEHLKKPEEIGPIDLAFEDIYLNYPDRSIEDEHLSDLAKRDGVYHALNDIKKRVFLTVGHRKNMDASINARNAKYISAYRKKKKVRILIKPVAGIFDIKRETQITLGFKEKRRPITSHDHSAPGKILLIAENLIERSKELLNRAEQVSDHVIGALLALEAGEMLANKTPTTSLEAISLKHQHEAATESMFYGVRYNFDVRSRFREIKYEMHNLGEWFHPRTRSASEANARMGIINKLAIKFKEYNQYDEENECLKEIRRLRSKLFVKKRNVIGFLTYPIRRYFEELLNSQGLFFFCILLWPVAFGLIFYISRLSFFSSPPSVGIPSGLDDFMIASFLNFFALQTPDNMAYYPMIGKILITLEVVLGFSHLGIFINNIYNMISRRG